MPGCRTRAAAAAWCAWSWWPARVAAVRAASAADGVAPTMERQLRSLVAMAGMSIVSTSLEVAGRRSTRQPKSEVTGTPGAEEVMVDGPAQHEVISAI